MIHLKTVWRDIKDRSLTYLAVRSLESRVVADAAVRVDAVDTTTAVKTGRTLEKNDKT